jgi:hypothetical protein
MNCTKIPYLVIKSTESKNVGNLVEHFFSSKCLDVGNS